MKTAELKIAELKIGQSENWTNWKLDKLKIGQIENWMNWKWDKLKMGQLKMGPQQYTAVNGTNWKWDKLKIGRIEKLKKIQISIFFFPQLFFKNFNILPMEHQWVLPDHDGNADWSHTQDIIGLKPHQVVRIKGRLADDAQVDKIAEIQHKQFGFLRGVVIIAIRHQNGHNGVVKIGK